MASDAPVELSRKARAIRETKKALLVRYDGQEIWFPKSVIHDDSEVYEEGGKGTFIVQQWYAEKENML